MATIKQWSNLLKAKVHTPQTHGAPVVLDTAIGSDNSGDEVIMTACNKRLSEVFTGKELEHVATHCYSDSLELMVGRTKILCGTNILYTHMADQHQWAMPNNLAAMGDVVLLGVGMSDIGIEDDVDAYTKAFYRFVLAGRGSFHSVRDDRTKRFLNELGFQNVLNTACPTMWDLTPEFQKDIPCRKARKVITSVTDYSFSPDDERQMLSLLSDLYEKVVIWVQGSHDIDWCLSSIIDSAEFDLVGPNIASLDKLLEDPDFDYVGTRLHAGIRCLNKKHRALVVAVDNRAREIGRDTGLPVVERSAFRDGTAKRWIENPSPSHIVLPLDAIEKWKSQWVE